LEKILFKFLRLLLSKIRFYNTDLKRKLYKFYFRNPKLSFDISESKLEPDGFYRLSENDHKNLKSEFDLIKSSIEDVINKKEKKITTKDYLINVLREDDENNIKKFLDFFLNKKFLSIVNSHLNELPLLTELKLLYSPSNISNQHTGSQLFHRDFDDTKIVKIFINLVDVDLDTGPLEIIKLEKSKRIKTKINKNYGLHSDLIDKYVDHKNDKYVFVGKKFDCLFVDTASCYHRGSRKSLNDRYILYANFSSRSSFRFPPIFLKSKNPDIIKFHSPMIKYSNLISKEKTKFLINY
jgi:hypothetical protein